MPGKVAADLHLYAPMAVTHGIPQVDATNFHCYAEENLAITLAASQRKLSAA